MEVDDVAGHQDRERGLWSPLGDRHGTGTAARPIHLCVSGRGCFDETGSPADQTAAALHGLAHMVNRRPDMADRRIRIDLTIREKPMEEWR